MSKISEKAYIELKSRIIAGEFATKTKMREEHLAKMLGISRTPVRSALERLIEENLLQRVQSSIEVSPFQPWDLIEIFEIRLLLEPHVASLASLKCSDSDAIRLDELNDSMQYWIESTDKDRVRYIQEINNKFHHAILNIANSARLIEILSSYIDIPRITGSFYIYSENDLRMSLDQHRLIAKAIKTKNEVMAKESMKFHIMTSFNRVKDKLNLS